MTAAKYNITIEQGANFSRTITYKDSNGDPINLSTYTARMQIRENYNFPILVSLTTENGGITLGGSEGTIVIQISAVDSALLDFDSGIHDLELVQVENVTRIIEGNVFFSREVTK